MIDEICRLPRQRGLVLAKRRDDGFRRLLAEFAGAALRTRIQQLPGVRLPSALAATGMDHGRQSLQYIVCNSGVDPVGGRDDRSSTTTPKPNGRQASQTARHRAAFHACSSCGDKLSKPVDVQPSMAYCMPPMKQGARTCNAQFVADRPRISPLTPWTVWSSAARSAATAGLRAWYFTISCGCRRKS